MDPKTSPLDNMQSSNVRIPCEYPELRYIKALFLQRQYRRCVTICRDLLASAERDNVNSVSQTFVQFYLALAHDEIARGMHNYSQARVPAFNQAEEFYYQTIISLPTAQQCIQSLPESAPQSSDELSDDEEPTPRLPNSNSFSSNGTSRAFPSFRSPTATHVRNQSIPTPPPAVMSPGTEASDLDDLESHESFDQIMTPTRMPKLERDYSSISLLQSQQQQLPQGPMQPLRTDSPLEQYRVPPKLSYTGNAHQSSKLPRLNTGSLSSSPVRKQLRTPSEQVSPIDSPVSPVSPLGSEWDERDVTSDVSTISPVSPETPFAGDETLSPNAESSNQHVHATAEHLKGMRSQLETHIKLLREAKQRTQDVQAERAAARKAPNRGGQLTAFLDASGTRNRRIQQSQSYWSFTPEDIKLIEKQKRIQDGRRRGWMRARFDPTRYSNLADRAMAEL